MKLLNLGCGKNFHSDWINLDFKSSFENVIECNLLNGIPYPENTFDAIYHSHVLEHFTPYEGEEFIKECYRVLKPGGIIRIAVPDLENIARNYLKQLEEACEGTPRAIENYYWMKLELIDQMVRFRGGGEMGKYLAKRSFKNEAFLRSRLGVAFDEYMHYFESNRHQNSRKKESLYRYKRFFRKETYLNKLKNWLFKQELKELGLPYMEYRNRIDLRKFRLSGSVHQWMYDKLSLKILLEKCGFGNFIQASAYESSIPEWDSYSLDVKNGSVRKPDSIFVEAKKIEIEY